MCCHFNLANLHFPINFYAFSSSSPSSFFPLCLLSPLICLFSFWLPLLFFFHLLLLMCAFHFFAACMCGQMTAGRCHTLLSPVTEESGEEGTNSEVSSPPACRSPSPGANAEAALNQVLQIPPWKTPNRPVLPDGLNFPTATLCFAPLNVQSSPSLLEDNTLIFKASNVAKCKS